MSANTVPVEHRLLGLDRRKMGGTFAVLLLVLLWAVIAPHVDASIKHDNEAAPGEVFDVGSGVTIVPPTRWQVDTQTGLTVGTLVVHNAGVSITVTVGPFDGELPDLLDQANETLDIDGITSAQSSITTTAGSTGLIEAFTGISEEGRLAVFSEDKLGVVIEAVGPAPQVTRFVDEIDEMIISLKFGEVS